MASGTLKTLIHKDVDDARAMLTKFLHTDFTAYPMHESNGGSRGQGATGADGRQNQTAAASEKGTATNASASSGQGGNGSNPADIFLPESLKDGAGILRDSESDWSFGGVIDWVKQKHREWAYPELYANNGVLLKALKMAWVDSQWTDPVFRHEEGGYWGYEADGSIGIRRWDKGTRGSIEHPQLEKDGTYKGLTVQGMFHTHPSPRGFHPDGSYTPSAPSEEGDRMVARDLMLPGRHFIVDNWHVISYDHTWGHDKIGGHEDVLGSKP